MIGLTCGPDAVHTYNRLLASLRSLSL